MSNYIGREIGGYRILEQVGVGGMATVYKAYQPGMDRVVALKVLPDYYAKDESYLKRFQQEAKVIANLEHRHSSRRDDKTGILHALSVYAHRPLPYHAQCLGRARGQTRLLQNIRHREPLPTRGQTKLRHVFG